MGRADQTCVRGGGGLESAELIHAGLVEAAPARAEGCGEDKGRLRARGLVRPQAPSGHHRKVRAQAVAEILIRPAEFVLESLAGQQHPAGPRSSASRGPWRETLGKTVLDGGDERRPREGSGPWAQGMGIRHKVGDVQRHSSATPPMLEVANKAHRKRSSCKRGRGRQNTTRRANPQALMEAENKLVTTT